MAISALAQRLERLRSVAARRLASKRGARRNFRSALGMFVFILGLVSPAVAESFRDGTAALSAHNYTRAAQIFSDLAVAGDPRAQTYLGFMFANGEGVPQNFVVAAGWYRCAVEQNFPSAEYFLGLMYDKGQGVPQDYVVAYALLNLAVAGAGRERDYWVKIRDAVASKLSLVQRLESQHLAFLGPPQQPCLPIVTGY
ncbi:tetratricopeptide repeat protein [Methylocapsa polymorpha]|uniref:Tetratricopeptide repeat protein n=1 Tax=Methylocapsa polymorpha TaxID=3080828 RepID=A0ABZ0HS73_9HYPH|nr:tetratricopeptide repeat protein [Methylocapsa sp. RX1]